MADLNGGNLKEVNGKVPVLNSRQQETQLRKMRNWGGGDIGEEEPAGLRIDGIRSPTSYIQPDIQSSHSDEITRIH